MYQFQFQLTPMKKILAALIFTFIFYSCDDGDITVTSFDFEDSNLQLCEIGDKKVLWVVKSQDVFESMSLELKDDALRDNLDERILTTNVGGDPIEIELNEANNNRLVYRIYDGEVKGNEYFCQAVPPASPRVKEGYVSGGGTVIITTVFNDLAPDADTDGDGISNIDEGIDLEGNNHLDTDGDGIPDYLDIDDDNDNVNTEAEKDAGPDEPTVNGYLDTDEDGIPDYLDTDDDGDGVLTRYEVKEEDVKRAIKEGNNALLSPKLLSQSADGRANYLVPELSEVFYEHEEQLDHHINRNYRSNVQIKKFNLIRQDGSGEDISFLTTYNLGKVEKSGIFFEQLTNAQQEAQDNEDEENTEEENTEETEN